MCQTPHLLVGAALGILSQNSVCAFSLGFVSHLVLDLVPHYDIASHYGKHKHDYFIVIFCALDLLLGCFLVACFLYHRPYDMRLLAFWGALGSFILDFLDIVLANYLFPSLRQTLIGRACHWLHTTFHSHDYNHYWYLGIMTQVLTCGISMAVMYFL